MAESESDNYSEAEWAAEFDLFFPHGFAGPDVREELAPEGWQVSPLRAVFHPSPEQMYEEACRMHQNLLRLRRKDETRPPPSEPTVEEFAQNYVADPGEPEREMAELVGLCLWDLFSDNHDVVGPDGRVLHLGSFRYAGGFLAEYLNGRMGTTRYDYIDFYLGTVWVSQRADLTPVYRMIFRRLRGRGFDWVYSFPRIGIVDFRPLRKALDRQGKPDWEGYSPSEALAEEEEEREHNRRIAELQESLDEGYRESVAEALCRPPPTIVQAYREVYGDWPRGWPPTV
jgi:hypothetical protein